jgi:predicted amidohydrolase YtcJ
MDLGLRSFEHAYTLGVGVLSREEFARVWAEEVPAVYGDRQGARFYLGALEVFNHLGPDDPRMIRLIDRLAKLDATVDPTLHIFAQRVGLASFATPPMATFDDDSGLTARQLEHARAGYRILAGYVKRLHAAGVRLAIGSDWIEPGRVCLSEMVLLHDAGIPMPEVLAIATLGGATAIGADDVTGTIEPGKRANLVLWDRSPLEDAAHVWAAKTVIKNGRVFEPTRR